MPTFAERVAAASADWVYVPPDARAQLTDEYSLVAYAEHWQPPTQLFGVRSDRTFAELRDEVDDHARAWGRPDVGWWVDPASRPVTLADDLAAAGGRLDTTVSVLAYDLAGGLPDVGPVDVRAEIVTDVAGLRGFVTVNHHAWGAPPPDDADYERLLRDTNGAMPRAVAWVGSTPVAAAGLTIVGDVARLWGGATVEGYRRRGAYRGLLAVRLAAARERGATLALVKGVVTTSAPILRRLGFGEYGEERCLRLPVAATATAPHPTGAAPQRTE